MWHASVRVEVPKGSAGIAAGRERDGQLQPSVGGYRKERSEATGEWFMLHKIQQMGMIAKKNKR